MYWFIRYRWVFLHLFRFNSSSFFCSLPAYFVLSMCSLAVSMCILPFASHFFCYVTFSFSDHILTINVAFFLLRFSATATATVTALVFQIRLYHKIQDYIFGIILWVTFWMWIVNVWYLKIQLHLLSFIEQKRKERGKLYKKKQFVWQSFCKFCGWFSHSSSSLYLVVIAFYLQPFAI